METIVLVGLALNFVVLLVLAVAVLRRKAEVAPADHHGLRLARAALAAAKQQHPEASGDDLIRKAVVIFRELDLGEDNKRDFSDRQAAFYVRASL